MATMKKGPTSACRTAFRIAWQIAANAHIADAFGGMQFCRCYRSWLTRRIDWTHPGAFVGAWLRRDRNRQPAEYDSDRPLRQSPPNMGVPD